MHFTPPVGSQPTFNTVLGKRGQSEPSSKNRNPGTPPKKNKTYTIETAEIPAEKAAGVPPTSKATLYDLAELLFNPESREPKNSKPNESIVSKKINVINKSQSNLPVIQPQTQVAQATAIRPFDMGMQQYDLVAKQRIAWGQELPVDRPIGLFVHNPSEEPMRVQCVLTSSTGSPVVVEKINDIAPSKINTHILTFFPKEPASQIAIAFVASKTTPGSQQYGSKLISPVARRTLLPVPEGEKEFCPPSPSLNHDKVGRSVDGEVSVAAVIPPKPRPFVEKLNLVFYDIDTDEVILPINKHLSVKANTKIGMRLKNRHTEAITIGFTVCRPVNYVKLAVRKDVVIGRGRTVELGVFDVPDYISGADSNIVLVNCFVKKPQLHSMPVTLDIVANPKSTGSALSVPVAIAARPPLPAVTTIRSSNPSPVAPVRPHMPTVTTVRPSNPTLARAPIPLPTVVTGVPSPSSQVIASSSPSADTPSSKPVSDVSSVDAPTENTPVGLSITLSDPIEKKSYGLNEFLKPGRKIDIWLSNTNKASITVVMILTQGADQALSQRKVTLTVGEMQYISSFIPKKGDNLAINCMARYTDLPESARSWTASYKLNIWPTFPTLSYPPIVIE